MRRRYFDLCVTASSRTMLTFENNVSCSSRDCSTIACCRLYVDVNTLASKRSELLGNADILRMRRVIHKTSTCVCLRIPVAAITQKRKNASVDLWPALDTVCQAAKQHEAVQMQVCTSFQRHLLPCVSSKRPSSTCNTTTCHLLSMTYFTSLSSDDLS